MNKKEFKIPCRENLPLCTFAAEVGLCWSLFWVSSKHVSPCWFGNNIWRCPIVSWGMNGILWIPKLCLHLLCPNLLRLWSLQLGWPVFFFFFAFPRVSLLAKDKLFLCHSKYFNLSATGRECNREGPSQEFTHEGEWCKRIWTGRSQRVLVSFFLLWRQRVDVDLEKETREVGGFSDVLWASWVSLLRSSFIGLLLITNNQICKKLSVGPLHVE